MFCCYSHYQKLLSITFKMRYKLRPYDVNNVPYTRTNAEGKKYYFREIDAEVQCLSW